MNRLWIATLLAAPALSFAQGMPASAAQRPPVYAPTTKPQNINAWTAEAASNAAIGRGIKRFEASQDFTGYQVTIDYDPGYFRAEWSGDEQAFATGDTYHLAEAFVQVLLKNGIDPSNQKDPKVVQVCAREGGFTSVTGKPQFANLGCSEYDPSTDTVSRNDRGG